MAPTKSSLSLSQALQRAWELYRQYFSVLMPTSIISYLLVDMLFYFLATQDIKSIATAQSLAYGLVELQIMILVYQKLRSKPSNTLTKNVLDKEQAKRVYRTWGLGFILTSLLALLLLIPGILFSVWWAFGTYIAMDTTLTGMDALKKSKEMVKGQFWKLFGAGTIRNMLYVVILFLPPIILPGLPGEVIASLGTGLITPYFAILLYVLYRG